MVSPLNHGEVVGQDVVQRYVVPHVVDEDVGVPVGNAPAEAHEATIVQREGGHFLVERWRPFQTFPVRSLPPSSTPSGTPINAATANCAGVAK